MGYSGVSSKTKHRYKRAMNKVVKTLGRKIEVYKQPFKAECSNCYYDKLTDSSTGKCKWTPLEARAKQIEYGIDNDLRYKYFKVGRCPICKGRGYLETSRSVWVSCLVIWNPNNRNSVSYTPAGTEGSTIVELKSDTKNFLLFKNCKKLVVDGINCRLSKPPILRGLGNQTTLVITAFTTDKASINSDEILKNYLGD